MKAFPKFILLAGLSALTFLVFLNGPDIVTSHEARVAQPARLMAACGWPWSARPASVPAVMLRPGIVRLEPDYSAPPLKVNPWLVPVLNGRIRLQKPPLPYWCAAVALKCAAGFKSITSPETIDRVFEAHGEWLVRFFPALMGAAATFFLFDLGRRLFGPNVGICSALAWVSTYAACEMYRKAMADPYLAFFTLVCVWAWVVAGGDEPKANLDAGENPTREPRPFRSLMVFYAAFALALLAKGPPAVVNILFPLAAYHLCLGRRLPGRRTDHLIGIGLLLLIAAPWPLYVWRNVPHAMDVWRYESVGELGDNTENARQWWFYLPQLFYLAMPWTPLWVVGCVLPFNVRAGKTRPPFGCRGGSGLFFPLVWWGATVVFFSFLNQKKNAYLLPALPAQSLMIGLALAALVDWLRETRFKGAAGALAATQAFIGIGSLVAMTLLARWQLGSSASFRGTPALCFAVVFIPFVMFRDRGAGAWASMQALAYTVLIVLTWRCFITPLEDGRSARPLARQMAAMCRDPQYTVLMARLPEEVAVYLPIEMSYGFGSKVLVVVDDTRAIHERAAKGNALSIPQPRPEFFQGWLPDAKIMEVRNVPVSGAPADYRWKLYELTVQRSGYAAGILHRFPSWATSSFCARCGGINALEGSSPFNSTSCN